MAETGKPRELAPAAALLLIGAVLLLTALPSAFTVDENNYLTTVLALRDGRLSLPGTDGLTPSIEFFAFDPAPAGLRLEQTPVSLVAPPLFAPLALPFSFLGWQGLLLLEVGALLLTAWGCFRFARARSEGRAAPWVALGLVLAGSFTIEYAQGIWPHMVAMALTTFAFLFAARSRAGEEVRFAALAGLLAGVSAGIRYQNIVLAGAVGLGLLLLSRSRLKLAVAYAAGLGGPVLLTAFLNWKRLGLFHPFTKGPGYTSLGAGSPVTGNKLSEIALSLYAKVVDYSHHAPLRGPPSRPYAWGPDPELGAFMAYGGTKKALLQSAPWFAIALVILVVCWSRRLPIEGTVRRELRALSLPVFAVLALFAYAGFNRHDGLTFNQRYFIELLPLGATAVALLVDRLKWSPALAGAGLGVGLLLAGVLVVQDPEAAMRVRGLMTWPLAMSALTLAAVGAWLVVRTQLTEGALVAALGMGVGWAFVVHLGDDVAASRRLRHSNLELVERWEPLLPDHSALFLGVGADATTPLHLNRDLLVLDVRHDDGKDAQRIATELLAQGRRVFVDRRLIDPSLWPRVEGARRSTVLTQEPGPLLELLAD